MMPSIRRTVIPLFVLCFSSCGGTPAPSPLIGFWSSTVVMGMTSTTTKLKLNPDGLADLTTIVAITGDCTQTITLSATWTSDTSMITITPKAGTDMKAGCMDPNANASGPATSGDLTPLSGTYTATSTTLFINAGGQTFNFTKTS